MYKIKPCRKCEMPASEQLNVLILNGSLKHEPDISNTEELAGLVVGEMESYCETRAEVVRLADKNIPAGLDFRESEDDDWPAIAEKIRKADVVVFATPIWWGGRSSLLQRAIERMDAFDEEYIKGGRSVLYNKVAGVVITGSEDGALHTMGTIMTAVTWFGFTLPPECAAYWVGEVGQPPKFDREKRLENEAVRHMAKNLARNLVYYAQLLKKRPLKTRD